MEPDFSGYATRNDLTCSDGLTIKAGAFQHNDGTKVPLVWQHQHNDPTNVLGHALLENRQDGVYAYGFFNNSPAGEVARESVKHGDITALSIYANNLSKRGKDVLHGQIREVSLVLSGANPGAFIDMVNIKHADGDSADEAIIYTGLTLEHSDNSGGTVSTSTESRSNVQEVLETLNDEQQEVVHFMLEEALAHGQNPEGIQHAAGSQPAGNDGKTVKDVFDSMTEEQKNVVYFMIGQALESAGADGGSAQHSGLGESDILQHIDSRIQEGFSEMTRNVFEQNGTKPSADKPTLTHSQLEAIIEDAKKPGNTLKESFLAHAANYGIQDIDILFPDAKSVTSAPDVIGRRTEWVASILGDSKHSPFSRIKSTAVDLTAEEARAKGYVKGNLKKEEIIKLLKRVTTPTTVYKKQKLDRDDIIDITDLDVVAWLKAEMRVMLDEEIARAVLIGDGREPDDEDKINEDHLRPIAWDDDMYAHQVNVPSNISADGIVESVLRARTFYKGTGTPTFYTTDAILTDLILLKDKVGRRLYNTEAELAAALRVDKIVVVEVMESVPDVLGIIVNIADYTIGADRGGQVGMFDDFDIDYNQYKYLIESRISGALTKPKSAVVLKRTSGTTVTPEAPAFDPATNTITIPSKAGVEYYDVTSTTAPGTPLAAGNVVITKTTDVEARPAAGYSFPHNTDADWTFAYTAK